MPSVAKETRLAVTAEPGRVVAAHSILGALVLEPGEERRTEREREREGERERERARRREIIRTI